MRHWDIREAETHLNDVVRDAAVLGPQEILVDGKKAAVVLSTADFERLQKPKQSFVEFMTASPLYGVDINIEQDRGPARDVDL